MKSESRPMQVQPYFIRDHLKQYSIPAPASRSSGPRLIIVERLPRRSKPADPGKMQISADCDANAGAASSL